MKERIVENKRLQFINVSKKKEGIFVNFKVKFLLNGIYIHASVAIDVLETGIDPSKPLQDIVQEASHLAASALKKVQPIVDQEASWA